MKLLPELNHLSSTSQHGKVGMVAALEEIAAFITKRKRLKAPIEIVFVCTHNSCRSQFAQALAQMLGVYYKLNLKVYSAGTEVTRVHPTVVRTLEKAGFEARKSGEKYMLQYDTRYILQYGTRGEELALWSKALSDTSLPTSGFLAVMVCSDADEACPVVPGAAHRVSLPFSDPKISDGTDDEADVYKACMLEILAYLSYALSSVDGDISINIPDSSISLLDRLKNVFRGNKTGARRPDIERAMERGSDDAFPNESVDMSRPPSQRIVIQEQEVRLERSEKSSASRSSNPSAPQSHNPFQKGHILYAVPDHMQLEMKTRCTVRIASEQIAKELLTEGLDEATAEAATTEGVKITPMMKVELVEAEQKGNFDIINRNDPEQPVFPFGFTEWEFDVTPKRPGHYALLLRVTAKVMIPGFGEKGMNVAVLDRAIQVSTDGSVSTASFKKQPIPDPVWEEDDTQAVHTFICNGRTDKAIERMCNYIFDKSTDIHASLLILQGRWNDNTNKLEEKLIRHEDWDIVNNQVRVSVLGILEDLKTISHANL